MKKITFLKYILVLLFSVSLDAMSNSRQLVQVIPDFQDYSWTLFNEIQQNWNLNINIINGGFISLGISNYDFRELQRDEMETARETFQYGIPGVTIRKDIYSDQSRIESLSCPIIGCPAFEIGDTVAQINGNGEFWHLDCLYNILRKEPSYKNVKFLIIYSFVK